MGHDRTQHSQVDPLPQPQGTQPDSADDASGTAQNENILRRLVGIYESRFRESGKFTHIVYVNGFSYKANGRCRFYTEFINETNASAGSTQNLTGRCELVPTKLIQAIAFYPQHRNGTVWTWGVRPNGSNTNGAIDEAIAKGTSLLFDFGMPDDNSFVVSRSGQFVRNNMRRKVRGAAVARPRTAPRGLFFARRNRATPMMMGEISTDGFEIMGHDGRSLVLRWNKGRAAGACKNEKE